MSLTFMSPALSMASKRPTRPQHLFEHNFIHAHLWYCWCWIVHPAITWFYKVLYIPRGAGSLRSIWYLYFKPLSLDNWMSLSTCGTNLRLRVFETNLIIFLKQRLFDRPCHPKELTWVTTQVTENSRMTERLIGKISGFTMKINAKPSLCHKHQNGPGFPTVSCDHSIRRGSPNIGPAE